jgi:hypothetical protein
MLELFLRFLITNDPQAEAQEKTMMKEEMMMEQGEFHTVDMPQLIEMANPQVHQHKHLVHQLGRLPDGMTMAMFLELYGYFICVQTLQIIICYIFQ